MCKKVTQSQDSERNTKKIKVVNIWDPFPKFCLRQFQILFWAELCLPKGMLKHKPSVPVNGILLANRVFYTDVIKLRWGPVQLGWDLLQYNLCPCKERAVPDKYTGTTPNDYSSRLERYDCWHVRAKRKARHRFFISAFKGTQSWQHLDFRLLASRILRE